MGVCKNMLDDRRRDIPHVHVKVSMAAVASMSSNLRIDKVCRVGTDWFGNGQHERSNLPN